VTVSDDIDCAAFDRQMMQSAVLMARRGLGATGSNPSVGAVLANPKTRTLISRATTAHGGRPHAETQAINAAGEAAKGASLYVTLEPCSHFGGTPPCVNAIREAGISRVSIGMQDPDPRVAGSGIAALRQAGVAVQTGLLGKQCQAVTRGHALRVSQDRPFVQLKLALNRKGQVPQGAGGQPNWVTGPLARRAAHVLRAEADAILVGRATLEADDPMLNCRLPGLENRSPMPVVLSQSGNVSPAGKLFAGAQAHPAWVITSQGRGETQAKACLGSSNATIMAVPVTADGLDISSVLSQLAEEGITRLLVEGGVETWSKFAAAAVVDELQVFIGGGASEPLSAAEVSVRVAGLIGAPPGPAIDQRNWGDDRLYIFAGNADT
jgi:diaminohydroxyphosphoribosylaminopyrimidine deaminase / 5-amino-6-(5-phosphoribosylamino)uracil reductase